MAPSPRRTRGRARPLDGQATPVQTKTKFAAPALPPAPDAVFAEFELKRAHCCIAREPGDGLRVLGRFEVGGQRYAVCERVLPADENSGACVDPVSLLTARELSIVRLVCIGQVNKQIAHRLKISEYTVKTYLKQIFIKLNVHSRSAMVFRCAGAFGAASPAEPAAPR